MAHINRLCSPVVVYEADEGDDTTTGHGKPDGQQEVAGWPVPCLVGSIGKVNEKIAHLQLLPCRQQLINHSGYDGPNWSEPDTSEKIGQQSLGNTERDEKDVQMFSCVYQEQSSHALQLDMQHKSSQRLEKRDQDKPKLVEVHQYPGFSKEMPTPLPNNIALNTIMSRVVKAQGHLAKKPRYQAVFQSLLASPVMQDLLLDSFWWILLQNYQPDSSSQAQLFARLSESYVRFLTQSLFSRYGDVFLKEFPQTLSQALYCCFCSCFPQSVTSFHCNAFLCQLCHTAYQWVGGIRPAPDIFGQWDFTALEPEEVRRGEPTSGSDKHNAGSDQLLPLCVRLQSFLCPAGVSWSFLDAVSSSPLISPLRSRSRQPSFTTTRVESRSSVLCPSCPSLASMRPKGMLGTSSCVSMTAEHSEVQVKKAEVELKVFSSPSEGASHWPGTQSPTACPGPQFQKCVFNLWGHSPLVQFYLQRHRGHSQTGLDFLVGRTEIHKLPPYPLKSLGITDKCILNGEGRPLAPVRAGNLLAPFSEAFSNIFCM
ncbi:protein FAM227A isoform X2 [Amia ocellicauda]|uniref:protein FAM227A isoform X2 n=1 Tax=Amia ocellicauda TaxID=2972642 RepID=UPI003463BB5C